MKERGSCFIYGNTVNNECQWNSKFLIICISFISNNRFYWRLEINLSIPMYLKSFESDFSYIWAYLSLTDQKFQPVWGKTKSKSKPYNLCKESTINHVVLVQKKRHSICKINFFWDFVNKFFSHLSKNM